MLSSCINDLDVYPKTTPPSKDVYTSVENYNSVLAKCYASFVIAGQELGGGNADLSSNSGYDYMRCYINMQEVPTEECAYTWIESNKMTGLTYMSWDADDAWVSDTYYRIYYTISLCNEFLRNATDEVLSRFSEEEQQTLRQYRAEARFLRALAYYHAMDLYGNIPFVTENDTVGTYTPPRYTRAQIFEYIETELTTIEEDLSEPAECEYGRASQGAAWALLARMYLNAEVYTSTPRYTDCITYCNKIIGAGYSLEPEYAKLFNADNDKRTNEIIFPLVVDSRYTVSWGATTYIVCGLVGDNDSTQNPADYGVTSGWGMFRVRGELPAKFGYTEGTMSVADKRAMFHTDGQSMMFSSSIDDKKNGYFATKWSNLKDDGTQASNTASYGVDTDFPMFRLADVYLMLAESVVRGGTGATASEALGYVNLVRQRAYGDNSGDITAEEMTVDFFLDERARELYWECVRRTDLIRFGKFTSDAYVWQWKGNSIDGRGVDSKYNLYPIPSTEISANPNLYNENY